ncbi:squalene/phytoene synthase family protein [Bacillus tuaregi]|uniref:squalene/phytoene synthase family protein n=1 Tax=Bacillus tuaregi TaxID=1816695 RepID=UPI0008F88E11|nr:phytoene/squalene synthase family protein [Bacillus tuaregi]
MSETKYLDKNARETLKATSRTFYIPISHLAKGLQEAVASAYLCMRAIDEIEDHPDLDSKDKSHLLFSISQILQKSSHEKELTVLFQPYRSQLPKVTVKLSEWIKLCPDTIIEKVLEATSIMAKGMAEWVEKDWQIENEEDLDDYTYYVAGLVGVMLTDIWKWYDQTEADEHLAIAFGRGLQAVNILRNHNEDKDRGVSFFPEGWKLEDMFAYARRNLELADQYVKDIKNESILRFCKIPLALAHGTLQALIEGKEKMSRLEVIKTVGKVVGNI